MQQNSGVSDFVQHVRTSCRNHGIRLYTPPYKRVRWSPGLFCSGYFVAPEGSTPGKLAVARTNPAWLEVMIHEFCHLEQWSKGSPLWRLGYIDGEDTVDLYDCWIRREREYSKRDIRHIVSKIIELEKDCEQRSVQKIQDFGLPVDSDIYIQKANAYLYFYGSSLRFRKWGVLSLYVPEVMELMPTVFQSDYLDPPQKILKAIEKVCT